MRGYHYVDRRSQRDTGIPLKCEPTGPVLADTSQPDGGLSQRLAILSGKDGLYSEARSPKRCRSPTRTASARRVYEHLGWDRRLRLNDRCALAPRWALRPLG